MKYFSLFVVGLICVIFSFGQEATVYPTNWWVGMKHHQLQLLIKADVDFRGSSIEIPYQGI
jgi:hypothetical protein